MSKRILYKRFNFQDPRFNSEIDLRTGYKTNLILSMPICNYEGEVIGVAQIINKTNGTQEFTTRDVEVSMDHQSLRNGDKQRLIQISSLFLVIVQ